jgi:uncharacterized protein (TIGR02284 family)
METTKETIEILQDLVQINNDRIAGYEHALKELKDGDEDLKILFEGMIDESRKAKLALAEEIQVMGEDVKNQSMVTGKIYRAWMDVKAVFTGHNRQAVLENCHVGEDAAQKAYTTALSHDYLPAYLRDLIQEQKDTFKDSHDEIKALRDEEKVS